MAGGGALLDLAVYPLTWALGAVGGPAGVTAHGVLTAEGIDLQSTLSLTYDNGAHAQLITSIGAQCPSVVTVSGTEGWLRSSVPLFNPAELVIQSRLRPLGSGTGGVRVGSIIDI